jgi:hypothetical protein
MTTELLDEEIELVNMSLNEIGIKYDDVVNDIDYISVKYKEILSKCLQKYNWTFAIEKVKLNMLLDEEEQEGEEGELGTYKNKFATPLDAVKMIELYTSKNMSLPTNSYERRGKLIYSNHNELYLKYIKYVEPSKMSDSFKLYFQSEFSASVCYRFTGDEQALQQLKRIDRIELLNDAIINESVQNNVSEIMDNPFVDCRN